MAIDPSRYSDEADQHGRNAPSGCGPKRDARLSLNENYLLGDFFCAYCHTAADAESQKKSTSIKRFQGKFKASLNPYK
jgi:hypothetical protein